MSQFDFGCCGEAELGLHQISEIVPVKGVELAGPLPAEIQNFTVYAGRRSSQTRFPQAADAFLALLASPQAKAALIPMGMEAAGP